MKVVLSRLLLVILGFFLSAGSFFVSVSPAQAAIPKIIHYQGRLYNSSGTLLGGAGTNYYFKFSIYDTATVGTGTKLWPAAAPTTQTVGVQYGVFNYDLGDTVVNPTDGDLSAIDFQAKGDTLYLQIDVSSDNFVASNETLAPRQRIVSQSNALNSEKLQGATPGTGNSNILKLNATGGVDLTGTTAGLSAAGSNTLTLNGSATGNIQFFNSSYTLSNTGALTIGSVTGTGNLTIASGGVAPSNLILNANGAGTITLASGSTGDVQFFSASNKISSSGNLTVAGTITASTTGSLNGVNVNAGAVSGVSTLNLTGAITGATATNTINGLIVNAGALSGITTINASGQITSTLGSGTAPFVVASSTNIPNLNASSLNGATFTSPGTIGGATPGAGTFTTLTAQTSVTFGTAGVGGLLQSPIDNTAGTEKGFVLNHTGTALVQVADRLFEVQEGGVAKFSVDKDGLITTGSVNNASVAASAGIVYSKLNLTGSIVGGDLVSNIAISTTGNLATTGTGTVTSAGLLTASNGLSVTGTLTLPTSSIADSALSSNVALLTGIQTFSGAKTFSATVSLGAAGTAGTLVSLINNTAGNETAFVLNHTGSAFAQAGDLLADIQEGGVSKFSVDRTGLITTASVNNASVAASAGIVYSKLSLSNSIVNADINASAAIAYSKLSLSASIQGSDLATNIAISTTGNIATTGTGTITSSGVLTAPSLAVTNATNQIAFGTGAGTTGTFSFTASGGNKTLTFPNATANVCTDGSVCSGYQASLGYTAANAALSNLAAVAINTSLLPGADNAIDFGDGTHQLRTGYIGTSLILGTSGANKITLNFTTPTGARVITLPDNAGTVAVAGTAPVSVSATGAISVADATTSSKGIASFNSTNFTTTSGAVNTVQNIDTAGTPTFSTLSLSSNTNPLVLGTTNTATFALGALGASQTYTLPTTGGTFATNGSNAISISSAGTTSLNLAGNTASATTSSNSGLVIVSTGLSLLRGCSDQEVEKFFTADNTWRCATGGSSSSALSSITTATAANSINSGDNAQVWNWSITTASKSGFTFGENVASAGSNAILLNLQTLSASTASPFQVTAGGTANGVKVDTTGLLQAIGTGGIKATTLNGATFAAPGTIGGTTPAGATFTTVTANTSVTDVGLATAGVVTNTSAGLLGTLAGTTTTVLHGNASGLPTFGGVVNGDLTAGSFANITGIGTLSALTVTSSATSGTIVSFSDAAFTADGSKLLNLAVTNASAAVGATAVNGVSLDLTNGTNTNNSNTVNGVNFPAATNTNSNIINGINFASATGFTNFFNSPLLKISSNGQIQSTVTTGTAPFTVSSTTVVNNLNAAQLNGATFAAPGTIGGTTPGAATFTTVTANTSVTDSGLTTAGVVTNSAAGLLGTLAGTTTTLLHGNASGAPTFSSVVGGDLASNIAISTTGSLATTGAGTFSQTYANTVSGNASTYSITNNSSSVGATTVSGQDITLINGTNANNSNTVNGVTFEAATNTNSNTINGISFLSATGFTNFFNSPLLKIASNGQIQSTVATGTAPFTVASTTNVANLNASSLNGATFAAPGAIGSTTASSGAFTTLSATTSITNSAFTTAGVVLNSSAGLFSTAPGTTTTVLHGNAAGLPTFGGVVNGDLTAGSFSNITGVGTLGALTVTSTVTSGTVVSFTDNSFTADASKLFAASVTNASAAAGATAVQGIDLTLANGTNANNSNTINGINFPAATNTNSNTINGINFVSANGFTNFFKTPLLAVSSNGQVQSTVTTGTAPFTVSSTTVVSNLNAALLNGATFAAPSAIGSTTANAGTFTTLNVDTANGLTLGNSTNGGIVFKNGTNANTVTVSSGATSASYSLTLPLAQASGTQFLQNDGSGNLSWAASVGGCAACVQLVPATTAANTIAPTASSVVALTVKGTTGTAANVLEIFDSTASPVRQAYFDNTGSLNVAKQIVSTVSTGTAPFSVASTTNVANLNASSLNGATFAAPGAIGGTTPGAGTFTTLAAQTSFTLGLSGTAGSVSIPFANTAGTDTGLVINHTGTAFAQVADLLLDVQEGGVSKASVSKDGNLNLTGTIAAATSSTINGVSINAGAISGVTTLGLSGAITGATATNTINNLVINAGALSNITTLSLSGQFTSTLATGTAPFSVASTTNVANLNASSLNGATFAAPGAIGSGTPGSGAFTTLSATTSFSLTNNTNTNDIFAVTNTGLTSAGFEAANFTFKNNNTGAGNIINGVTITESAAAVPSSGTNVSNLLNLTGAANGTVNGINFASNLTNYFTDAAGTTKLSSAGLLTLASTISANTTNTINSVSINAGAISGVTTLGLSGAITGATATNTINNLIINAGALSNITTIALSGAITGATSTNTINGLIINSGALSGITTITQAEGNIGAGGNGFTTSAAFNGASGIGTAHQFTLTDSTSSTGGFSALQITDSAGTGTGTGNKRLLDLQVGSSASTFGAAGDLIFGSVNRAAATSGSFNLLRLQSGTSLTDVTKINGFGDVLAGFTQLDGSTTTNGSGSASTSMVLTSGTNFDVGNYIKLVNPTSNCTAAIKTCYYRITAKATNTLTISPAATWDTAATVTEWHVPEIGGNNAAGVPNPTLTSRYGTGYFINGVVSGNGSTWFTDGSITQADASSTFNFLDSNTTTINIGTSGAAVAVPGSLTVTGTLTGPGPSSGTSGFFSRSGTTLNTATAGDAIGITGNISTSANISTTGSGTITSAGAISAPTATNTINNVIINAGAISNVSTFGLSGAITGATATNTINGLIINSGALSGISTINLTGAITGATATNTINGLIVNAGALSGVTGYTQTSGTHAVTSAAVSGDASSVTANSLNTASANAVNITYKNNNTAAAGLAVNGVSVAATGSAPASGTNTENLINLSATALVNNTFNAINFGTGLTNYLNGTNFTVTSAGVITAATSSTINGVSINAGAVSGVTTLGLSGAITGATATNTINNLVINAGALSNITTLSLSGQFTSTLATGTAPFSVASTTNVANLNASSLNGNTFANPGAIGSTTASTGAFTTLSASTSITDSGLTANGVVTNTNTGVLGTLAGTTTTVLHGNASGLPTFGAIVNGDLTSGSYANITGVGTLGSLTVTGTLASSLSSLGTFNVTENLSATGTVHGLTLAPTLGGTAATNTYTLNALNVANVAGSCPATATCVNNALNLGTGYTNLISSTNLNVRDSGNTSLGGASYSNVRLGLRGTVTSANSSFGVYTGDITLTPTTSNNAYFQYTGGTVDTGASAAINNAYGLFAEAITKAGTGTITNTYGIWVNPSTSGGSNFAGYFGGNVGIRNQTPGSALAISDNTFVSSGDLINATIDTTSTGNFLRLVNEATEKFKIDVNGAVTLAGAITGATATNTINNLIINAGALSNITTINASGQITSTLANGTAPFVVTSSTNVANLNASSLNGAIFAAPGAIGGTTPGAGTFTTLAAQTSFTLGLSATAGSFSIPFANTAGTDTGLVINHSGTAFAQVADLLVDVQEGAVSKFSVSKDGNISSTGTHTGTQGIFTANSNPLVLGTTNTASITLGSLASSQTYTLPTSGGTFAVAATNPLALSAAGVLTLKLTNANDTDATTSNNSGLVTTTNGVGLLRGCGDTQILKFTLSGGTWGCANDATSAGGTPVNLDPAAAQTSTVNNSIDINKTNAAGSYLNLNRTLTAAGAYSLNEAVLTRTVADGGFASTGSILKLIDSGTGTGAVSPDLLLINQANTSSGGVTGNLINAQLAGTSKFLVTTTGALTLSGAISAPTATNTINSLVINAGALSGITGYTQGSGTFQLNSTSTDGSILAVTDLTLNNSSKPDLAKFTFTNNNSGAGAIINGVTVSAGVAAGGSDTSNLINLSSQGATGTVNGLNFSGTLTNYTNLINAGTALTVTGGGAVTQAGNLTFSGAAPNISASTTNTSLTVSANGTGTVTLASSSTGNVQFFSSSNFVTSSGALTLASGATLGAAPTITNASGTLTINSAGALTLTSSANGTVTITPNGTGILVLGDSTNGITLAATTHEPSLTGTSRHTVRIQLTPEYSGATMMGSGTNNTGTMTSDNDNATPFHNFYKWTTSTASPAQTYDIWVRIPLPMGFAAWCATTNCNPTIFLYTKSSSGTAADVQVATYDTANAAVQALTSIGTTVAATYQENSVNAAAAAQTWTAGGYMTLQIRVSAINASTTQVGELRMDYLSKF